MSAYLIVDVARIRDEEAYARYRKQVSPGLIAAGGEYLARGGAIEVLEGTWKPGRLVVVRFDTSASARRWWGSDEYASLRKLRQSSTDCNMVVVDGVTDKEPA
jgi:uncharacterized protein (DUF1330 family)